MRFDFGESGNATIRVTTSWSPPYANIFWQLISLGYYDGNPPFRVDYRNASECFMAQMGWNLQAGVQDAWDGHRAIAQAVPAIESNTRGRVAMGMQAVMCNASAPVDPCAKYRPACTASDYCAYSGATQFFISYGNNSRLDAHGFAPFGEVVEGMETIDALIKALNAYQGGVILVSHDVHFVGSIVNELYVVADGGVQRFDGTVAQYKDTVVKSITGKQRRKK